MFQSQRRFFGGSNGRDVYDITKDEAVSIAEAILWGEQPHQSSAIALESMVFQSQRRFFGGSNITREMEYIQKNMFQSQRRFFGGSNSQALPYHLESVTKFQSQRRFFGGSNVLPR